MCLSIIVTFFVPFVSFVSPGMTNIVSNIWIIIVNATGFTDVVESCFFCVD